MIPNGAKVLPNPNGTAPGLALDIIPGNQCLILLPGPPRELRPMFLNPSSPCSTGNSRSPPAFFAIPSKPPAWANPRSKKRLPRALQPLVRDGLQLAYCARAGEVDVRLAARGATAAALLAEGRRRVEKILGPVIFGKDDDSLESVLIRASDPAQRKHSPRPNPARAAFSAIVSPMSPDPARSSSAASSPTAIRSNKTSWESGRKPCAGMARSANRWRGKWPTARAAFSAPTTRWL